MKSLDRLDGTWITNINLNKVYLIFLTTDSNLSDQLCMYVCVFTGSKL